MHPHDTPSLSRYLYGLTVPPSPDVHWIIGAPQGPDKPQEIVAGLRDPLMPDVLVRWIDRTLAAGHVIRPQPFALVAPAWEGRVARALVEDLTRAGHPIKNPSAREFRRYHTNEAPPTGYAHVCSMWERVTGANEDEDEEGDEDEASGAGDPDADCFYIGWTKDTATAWVNGQIWAANNPNNRKPNAPHLQRIRAILARGRRPYARVEATVPLPDKEGHHAPRKDGTRPKDTRAVRAAVRDVRHRFALRDVTGADEDDL